VARPAPPEALYNAIVPGPTLSRRNLRWAWSLTAVFVVLFAGTIAAGLLVHAS